MSYQLCWAYDFYSEKLSWVEILFFLHSIWRMHTTLRTHQDKLVCGVCHRHRQLYAHFHTRKVICIITTTKTSTAIHVSRESMNQPASKTLNFHYTCHPILIEIDGNGNSIWKYPKGDNFLQIAKTHPGILAKNSSRWTGTLVGPMHSTLSCVGKQKSHQAIATTQQYQYNLNYLLLHVYPTITLAE